MVNLLAKHLCVPANHISDPEVKKSIINRWKFQIRSQILEFTRKSGN
jgi:hypothetical protein